MLGLTPTAGAPIADFHNDLLFKQVTFAAGALLGGTTMPIGFKIHLTSVGGGLIGGATVWRQGYLTPGGYPMYGDLCYGDMPYLIRQTESVGGAIGGGQAGILRTAQRDFEGGALVGGELEYVRVWCRTIEGGFVGGGYFPLDGDFSKMVNVTFYFSTPLTLFSTALDKTDITDFVQRSLD